MGADFKPSFYRLQEMGLTADVLPVVWDKTIPRSAGSRIKSIGKVPTIITPAGRVAGIIKWTKKQSTAAELDSWAGDCRYGVALQTRRIRGLDIDVEDRHSAAAIADEFQNALGIQLPKRGRANSGKVLLAFELTGPLRKRSFRCTNGLVELLGDGQQFILDSIHVSGERYLWEQGLPQEFPQVTASRLDEAWNAICEKFAIEARSKNRVPKVAKTSDSRAEWLLAHWPNHGFGANGHLNIECPFKEVHSSDSGVTECSYLLAGTNGHREGRYHCFHASCADQSQADFDEATGFVRAATGVSSFAQWPTSIKLNQDGSVPSTIVNLTCVLGNPGLAGGELKFDQFVGEVFLHGFEGHARLFDDDARSELRLRLESAGFRRINRDDLREAVRIVARQNRYDSAQDWLGNLHWDRHPRVEQFLTDYLGAEDTDYARAVSRYMWTALAARVVQPGCQADMVPILVSPEGRHKSTALQAIPPTFEQFVEIDLHHRDADLSRMMKGKILGEIAELRGLQQRQVEGIKAFVTRRFEEWTPKYVEKPVRYERRLIFVGTTNDPEFLGRGTGERRWLPIRVEDADPPKIRRDRDQLWAEAATLALARMGEGRDPVIWETAYELAVQHRQDFVIEDVLESRIAEWLVTDHGRAMADQGFTTVYALINIVGLCGRTTPADQSRMANALRSCGLRQQRRRVGPQRQRYWYRAESGSA